MKRIVYYIIQGTAEENEKGLLQYSRSIKSIEKAKKEARQTLNDFVAIEKHQEYFDGFKWEIDYNFEIEQIEF